MRKLMVRLFAIMHNIYNKTKIIANRNRIAKCVVKPLIKG